MAFCGVWGLDFLRASEYILGVGRKGEADAAQNNNYSPHYPTPLSCREKNKIKTN